MTKGLLLVFSLALSVAAPALFCLAQTGQPRDVAHGKELFLRYCWGCHGGDGRGQAKTFRPNVANLSVKGPIDRMTDHYLFSAIKDGGATVDKNAAMPAGKS